MGRIKEEVLIKLSVLRWTSSGDLMCKVGGDGCVNLIVLIIIQRTRDLQKSSWKIGVFRKQQQLRIYFEILWHQNKLICFKIGWCIWVAWIQKRKTPHTERNTHRFPICWFSSQIYTMPLIWASDWDQEVSMGFQHGWQGHSPWGHHTLFLKVFSSQKVRFGARGDGWIQAPRWGMQVS